LRDFGPTCVAYGSWAAVRPRCRGVRSHPNFGRSPGVDSCCSRPSTLTTPQSTTFIPPQPDCPNFRPLGIPVAPRCPQAYPSPKPCHCPTSPVLDPLAAFRLDPKKTPAGTGWGVSRQGGIPATQPNHRHPNSTNAPAKIPKNPNQKGETTCQQKSTKPTPQIPSKAAPLPSSSQPAVDPEKVFTPEQLEAINTMIDQSIAAQDYDSLISELEDQVIGLVTKLHELTQEVEILWKETT
jgi:hypothetical protein